MRYFNTAGPVDCRDHYCLPPIERLNIEDVLLLIEQKKYFVLHAPRQTGKTSCLLALMDYMNRQGDYSCLYMNMEMAQVAGQDIEQGMNTILRELSLRAKIHLGDDYPETLLPGLLTGKGYGSAMNQCLTQWAIQSKKPLVLLMDEVDSLVGDTLISLLRQIRAGYDKRPAGFPQSIVLCGVRDVRDYRIHSGREKNIIAGGSAFNIKAKSLRLGNFEKSQVHTLIEQHEIETSQKFMPDTDRLIWEYTHGQPWLVNALAYEACFEMPSGKNRQNPITGEMITEAKERLIQRRETHIDQLADKLKEDRVRRVIGPILEGSSLENILLDDIQYTMDLGLIERTESGLVISNDIYKEIIPRELTAITQYNLEPIFQPSWFVLPDGSLDIDALLRSFQSFFRENSEIWLERFDYKEAGPHLLLQAFLQRIINAGGQIIREYGLGRKRTDLLIRRNYGKGIQKVIIELKILHGSRDRTIREGLKQTADYMDKCGSETGNLIIFDRRPETTWESKIFRKEKTFENRTIIVWGM